MITYYEAISQEVGGRSTMGLFGFHWILALAPAPFGNSLIVKLYQSDIKLILAVVITTITAATSCYHHLHCPLQWLGRRPRPSGTYCSTCIHKVISEQHCIYTNILHYVMYSHCTLHNVIYLCKCSAVHLLLYYSVQCTLYTVNCKTYYFTEMQPFVLLEVCFNTNMHVLIQ